MTGFRFTDAAGAAHTVNLLDDNTWWTADERVAAVLDGRFPRPQEVEDRAHLERRVISAARYFRASEVTPPLGHAFTPSWPEDAEKWDGLDGKPAGTLTAPVALPPRPAVPDDVADDSLGVTDSDRLSERPLGRGSALPADDRDL